MPKSIENQLMYSGGEWSPYLDARVDHPKYLTACRQLQNMIAMEHGGCTRRPGTIFKAMAKMQDSDVYRYATRLLKFQFSPSTSFVIEMGHKYMRFYSNRQQVVLNSAPAWVALTPYVVGNFVTSAAVIYYCVFNVTSATAPASDPVNWVAQSIYEIPSPYTGRTTGAVSDVYDMDVWGVIPCQINDVVYLVHPLYPVYKLVRLADTNWTLAPVDFDVPALLDPNPTGIFLAASATTGAGITLAATATAWGAATYYPIGRSVSNGGVLYTSIITHVSAGAFATDLAAGYWRVETVFTGGNVGGYFQLGHIRNTVSITQALTGNGTSGSFEAVGDCEFNTYGVWAATVDLERSEDGGTTWRKIRTINSVSDHNGSIKVRVGEIPALFRLVVSNWTASAGAGERAMFTVVEGIAYGFAKITAVASAYSATATVIMRFNATTPTQIWSEGAWSSRRGYPQAVTAFQQRMIYGGSGYEPQRIWGSQTDDLENFDRGDATLATDSFAFDLAAIGRGRIEWLIGQVDLFVGFSGAEWIVNAGEGSFGGSSQPITPQQINAGEHSAWGSATGIPPALVGNTVLYPQRGAKCVQAMQFSVYTNKYASNDLTSLSEHMFGAGVVQIDYQTQFRNQGIVWMVTKSGSMCGMTYDTQNEVFAWHRHLTGSLAGGSGFMSVAVINGTDTDDDETWIVARRGNTMIELMNPENWETAGNTVKGIPQPKLSKAIYVDSAITVEAPVSNVITGLGHLEGRDVIGLINGLLTFGPLTVVGGSITIEGFEPGTYSVDIDRLQIGLPIYYAVQGMRMDVDGRAGIIIGITKALSKVFLRLFNSLSGKIVGNGMKEIPIEYKTKSTPLGQIGALYTGQLDVVPESTQTDNPTLIVQGSDPLPLTLLATTVRIGITGSP